MEHGTQGSQSLCSQVGELSLLSTLLGGAIVGPVTICGGMPIKFIDKTFVRFVETIKQCDLLVHSL